MFVHSCVAVEREMGVVWWLVSTVPLMLRIGDVRGRRVLTVWPVCVPARVAWWRMDGLSANLGECFVL